VTGAESYPLITVRIRHEHDVVLARQRARAIARMVGFDSQDQVKFATAVSEIARNAFRYASGGDVSFSIAAGRDGRPPCNDLRRHWRATAGRTWWLMVRVADRGPGIADIDSILDGSYVSKTGMGLGIAGARKLNDCFAIESASGTGTIVEVGRRLPAPLFSGADAAKIAEGLRTMAPSDAIEELEIQNQEILATMDALVERQAAVDRLNGELAETNRGVLALYAELDDKAAELKRVSEYKSRFLSDISHELRTPLTSVQNLTQILLDRTDGDLTAEQERQVVMIRKSADGLTEMVNELLDLARIEAGKTVIRPAPFSVAELFASLRGTIRPLITNEAVTLIIDEEAAACIPSMHTDEQRVSQILRNFLSNAIKFTEKGSITLSAVSLENGFVSFSVTDTGVGIAESDLARIFEEFVQVEGPIQRRVRGTGLGLALTKKLADLLGGSVEVESTVGKGSRFTAIIPSEYPEARAGIDDVDG
jgi:signal transduction histidine kinase